MKSDHENFLMTLLFENDTAWKVSKHGVFSGPYFPVCGLNIEIYSVKLRIQSVYRKIRTRKTPYLDTFYAEYCFLTLPGYALRVKIPHDICQPYLTYSWLINLRSYIYEFWSVHTCFRHRLRHKRDVLCLRNLCQWRQNRDKNLIK